MTRKRETTFYSGVNEQIKLITLEVYQEKMFNPLRGGTPDMYYEHRRDLWVEYKYEALPARDTTLVPCNVSPLQDDWLTRNFQHGHEPWVIVGTHVGRKPMGVIFTQPQQWRSGMPCGSFKRLLLTREEIAHAIVKRTT